MKNGSPSNVTPSSPGTRVASPRPPLHPNTNIASFDSPRARRSPVSAQLTPSVSPPTGSTGVRIVKPRSPKSALVSDGNRSTRISPSLRSQRSVESQHSNPRTDVSSGKPSMGSCLFGVFLRTMAVAIFLLSSLSIAALTQTNLTLNWLYADGTWPLLSCPSYDIIVGYNMDVDGPFCELFMSFANPSALSNDLPVHVVVSEGQLFGNGIYSMPCSYVPQVVGSACTLNSWEDGYTGTPSAGCLYNVLPLCDATGTVTVGQILNIRGIFIGCVWIILVYAIVSLNVQIKLCRTIVPNHQRRLDASRNYAEVSAQEMTKLVDNEWSEHSRKNLTRKSPSRISPVAESGSFSTSKTPPAILSVGDLFNSDQWKHKLGKSLGAEAQTRRRVSTAQMKIQYGVLIFFLYFGVILGVMELVLFALPNVYSVQTVRSALSVILFQNELKSEIWTSGAVWLDFVVLVETLISVLLIIVSSLCFAQWPSLQVKVPHIMKIRLGIRRGIDTDFSQAAADGAIYTETICAVVACRESCSSEARRQQFVKRLLHLLTMFPPDSIFLVDSHPKSLVPVDPTWQVAHSVSPGIRYCFVPDCDSKSFAVHWFNSVWLPYLSRVGHCQSFTHFLLMGITSNSEISSSAIPLIPLDISIPRENLAINADNLRAVHVPICASGNGGLVACQDLDMKARSVVRLGESIVGSSLEVEQIVGIWERDALFGALGKIGISGQANGQMKQGLSVVKLRGRNHIGSMPHTFVGVGVPTSVNDLIVGKILSGHAAGEASRIGIAVCEIFSVFSLCNIFSWLAKPTLLLTTIVGGFIQLIRPFVVATLIFRDVFALATLAVVAVVLIYVHETVLLLVFASRPDLRTKWTVLPILVYPMYRAMVCWIIEIAGIYDFILGGCVRNLTIQPNKRAKELGDVPACPPFPIVNWFTVWKPRHIPPMPTKLPTYNEEDELSNYDDSSSIGASSPRHGRF